jgi:CelD/BcsL family acetyltransferase involved in cellulose biosynthesis/peptidoglycan/xylan/chitin deacetylase (PgdA/CDA1 family)
MALKQLAPDRPKSLRRRVRDAAGMVEHGLGLRAWSVRRRRAGGAMVLLYHSVAGPGEAEWIDPRYAVPASTFEAQIELLAATQRVMSLRELIDSVARGNAIGSRAVAITFDDGYRDNLEVAGPILARAGLPWTLFLPTAYIDRGESGWIDQLYGFFRARTVDHLEWCGERFDLGQGRTATRAYQRIAAALLVATADERTALLAEIRQRLGPHTSPPRLTMTWPEVRELCQLCPQLEIGVHTCEHLDLLAHPDLTAAELDRARATIERELGVRAELVSFPYGRADAGTSAAARALGFRGACGPGSGEAVLADTDPFSIPRASAPRSLRAFRRLINLRKEWSARGRNGSAAAAASVRIELIRPVELDESLVERWREIQHETAALHSPYFCPEFTQAVGRVRHDVQVAVLAYAQAIVGFFPFQRGRWDTGRPVGAGLCDYQGIVAPPGLPCGARELLRGCGLTSFAFDHLLASQPVLRPYWTRTAASHYVDLAGGFGEFERSLAAEGSELLKKHAQAVRRLEREVGPVRMELSVADPRVLDHLLQWKSDQYRRSGLVDVFSYGWTRALVRDIHARTGPRFQGLLSALYAGERLVAAHFGMRSETVWHWWFPAYDPALRRYSPGMVLLVEALRAAPQLGVTRLDLGKGDAFYKDRLRGSSTLLAEGRAELPSMASTLRAAREATEAWIRRSPILPLARIPGRWIHSLERARRFK